jgi:hypothetical protein
MMPAVDNVLVPKPLTYTLMYHGLWAVIFLLTAIVYWGIFLASGQPVFRALVPPLGLVALALVAGFGAWLSYKTRLGVLLGEATWDEAFTLSSWSSWAVLLFAPAFLVAWQWVGIPIAHQIGVEDGWAGVPGTLTEGAIIVEVIVWWLSHLLSVRGIIQGRRLYVPEPAIASDKPPVDIPTA